MNKKLIRVLLIFSLVFCQLLTPSFGNELSKENLNGANPILPWNYVKILGKGIDVDWSKTKDGRKYYNEQTVKDFKEAGVSHVRIRISEKATDELLQNLDKQINDCLKNGIIPIIAYQADEFKNNPNEKNIEEVVNWWSILANRYKNYSYLLSFDLLIEATDSLNQQPEKLNEIYEKLVSEIRKTNQNRIIMISPRLRSDASYLKELKIPSKHNDFLMAEWHFYAAGPSKENDRKLWTTGTDVEKKLINDKINEALLWQEQTGIPTWVGAWMPGNYNDGNDYSIEEQIVFATYMTNQLSQAKIPFAVNSDTKYYNRETNKWITEMKPVFNSIFNQKINQKKINVGFNAKGNLSTKEQCSYLNQKLELLKKDAIKTENLWIRVQGGTNSQKSYSSDWSDETITLWSKVQKDFGCKYIYVVNFNDTPQNQLALYKRFTDKGIKFDSIELGNEQYLPKFAASKPKEEVTKRTSNMTPTKYISMSEEYIKIFKSFNIPFYIQFAPEKEDNTNSDLWNNSIANALNNNYFSSKNILASIHLYERNGNNSLNENQISKIKNLVNHPINIAVTEYGVIEDNSKLSYDKLIKQELNLTNRLLSELENQDILLNQVLYTDYKDFGLAAFHSKFKGITPKGEAIFKIFNEYL